ncbi:MAG: hypothetical protein A3G25_13520 [Betaproteobacteria bacterium RIFCSPLOWO2_12_FULL_63_13]|nr:MAG: hypothetical protein A3G25_13520 [Betaproteobacteria bacterium RIFCSPLOWO2_12_FULL_63_13]
MADAAQLQDLVSLDHVDHPFPRHLTRWQVFYPVPRTGPRNGQNFRKELGPNFRNLLCPDGPGQQLWESVEHHHDDTDIGERCTELQSAERGARA